MGETASPAAERVRWTPVEGETVLPGFRERVTHPEFAGMEFVHVRAKSLLNHVPAAAVLPFEWTINVYRGCSHACTYCLAPETPVLMADGSQQRIDSLQAGDQVLGTERRGRYRRYVRTEVRDAWRTVKRAYRVRLADGTELIASGDHRFLSERGWTHVTPEDDEGAARPGLGHDDLLIGVAAGAALAARLGTQATGHPGLRVVAVDDLGTDLPMVDITTGTGDFVANGVVSHNCFARPTHTWLELDADRDFEQVIVVKVNAVERLRAELRRPSWRGEHVALGTNTDPYQRAEGRYRLTRGVVATLAEAGNPFSILTKGTLVTRDLDLLADAAARDVCTGVSLSIPTVDEAVWRLTEGGAPHPKARLETVAALRDAGIPSGVMLAPIIPGLSDGEPQLRAAIAGALEAGATAITPIVLHLRPGVREVFLPRLAAERPDLAERLAVTHRGANAPAEDRRRIVRTVRRIVAELGGVDRSARHVDDAGARHRSAARAAASPPSTTGTSAGTGEQLTLL
jgi:DNA repair photolyase